MKRILAGLALLAAAPAAAQARYQSQPDTLFYESVNPYRMYVVRGGDTLGPPVRELSVTRQLWRADGAGLRVEQRADLLQMRTTTRGEVFELTPRGVVRTIDGEADPEKGQLDLVLRLPADGDLRVGRVWHDTVDQSRPVAGGEYAYRATRELRVERMVDSLGGRMAVVRGSGWLRYRQTEPMDSAATRFWWMDVEGPVDETFLYDVEHGRMAYRGWRMDLRGTAGMPGRRGRVDTIPAGLVSMDTARLVDAGRARLLGRGLPPGDTTVSSTDDGDVLLHTVRRDGAEVESGFRRADGATLSARSRHEDGRTVRHETVYTTAHEPALRRTLELRGQELRVTGGRDTTLALPGGAWAVADYGMDEHLAPVLAHMAGEGGAIDILRPLTLAWERARVEVRPVEDAFVVVLRLRPDTEDEAATMLVITRDGDLLYAEGLHPGSFSRNPPAGSARDQRLEAIFGALMPDIGG